MDCPKCGGDLEGGGFGQEAYCVDCDMTFETDWDYRAPGDAFEWVLENTGRAGRPERRGQET